jgi:hypothetical protein
MATGFLNSGGFGSLTKVKTQSLRAAGDRSGLLPYEDDAAHDVNVQIAAVPVLAGNGSSRPRAAVPDRPVAGKECAEERLLPVVHISSRPCANSQG